MGSLGQKNTILDFFFNGAWKGRPTLDSHWFKLVRVQADSSPAATRTATTGSSSATGASAGASTKTEEKSRGLGFVASRIAVSLDKVSTAVGEFVKWCRDLNDRNTVRNIRSISARFFPATLQAFQHKTFFCSEGLSPAGTQLNSETGATF